MRLKHWPLLAAIGVAAILSPAPDVRTDAEQPPPSVVVRPDGTAWLWSGSGSRLLPIGLDTVVGGGVLGSQSVLVRASGTVWTWSPQDPEPFAQLLLIPRVRSLACGRERCLMVTGNERLVSWTGGTDVAPVPGVEDVAAVALGGDQAVAITHSGRVWAWAPEGEAPPTPVPGLSGIVSVAAGSRHQLVTSVDGMVWSWGANDAGQLGSNDPAARTTPDRVNGIERAVQVSAHGDTSYVLTEDGEVWAFGGGSPVPLRLESPGEIVRLHPVEAGVLAERSDGRFWDINRRVFLPLPKSIGGGSASAPPVGFTLTGSAAFIVGPGELSEGDTFIRERLEALGLTTTLVRQGEEPTRLGDASVVIVSSSVDAREIDGVALAALGVPIVTWERFLFAPMGLTRRDSLPSHGSKFDSGLSIIRPSHPLAAGLDGHVEVLRRPSSLTAGHPGPDAQVVAVAPDGGPGIFGYEAGAQTGAGIAPARRVGLFLPAAREHLLGDDGAALFDAALRWAVEEPTQREPEESGEGGELPLLGTILLVVANHDPPIPPTACPTAPPPPLSLGDPVYKSRMEALGFTVEVVSAFCAQPSHATGKAMVFVSHTAPTGDVEIKFRDVEWPVAIQNAGLLDDMQMTTTANRGPCSPPTSNTTFVLTPTHPIAGGLSGAQTLSASQGTQEWGTPNTGTPQNPSAVKVLGCDGNPDHSTTFTYKQHDPMVGSPPLPAPHRRTFWSFHAPIPNTFTEVGQDLFDRMILWTTNTPNQPPTVNAGPNQAATTCEERECTPITLRGHVFDDGQPDGTLNVMWSKVSGEGGVDFASPDQPVTEVLFRDPPNTGPHVLKLSASDGEFTTEDFVVIMVYGEGSNEPPTVDAGPDQVVVFPPGVLTLAGTVADDGLPNPPGALDLEWSKVSGPGMATFTPSNSASTTVTLGAAGKYVLRLTARDSVLSSYDDVVVTANKAALLVVGNVQLSPGDAVLKARMEALGFPVIVKKEATVSDADAIQKAFVWVSSTINEGQLPPNHPFSTVPTPVVVQNVGYLDNMRMTTGLAGSVGTLANQTAVTVSLPSHPLSAGLQGSVTTSTLGNYGWGRPLGSAEHVAHLIADSSLFPIFSYETGDALSDGGPAPERRLLFGPQGDAALSGLSPNGKRLLDAAILWSGRSNSAPWVDAGPPRSALLGPSGVDVSLAGWVVDDGLPPGPLNVLWSKAGGPGNVTFQNAGQAATTAHFTVAGNYVLRLTAWDSEKASSDLTSVTILTPGANAPPIVTTGPDQTIRLLQAASLTAVAADDGLPGPLSVSWTKVFGPPGVVQFSAPNALFTQATFPAVGVYVLRVTVSDGALTDSDEVQVTVNATRPALFVVRDATSPSADDVRVVQELRALGFDPTVRSQNVPSSEANDKDVVLISSSVDSTNVGPRFRDTAKPVVLWEFGLYDDMGMTAANGGTIVTGHQVTILRPEHPLAAQLTGTPTVYTHTGGVLVLGTTPSPHAVVVASQATPLTAPVLFAYERSSSMVGLTAPARRVGFFGESAASFTSAGVALFRAAVNWATERPVKALLVVASSTLSPSDHAIKERIASLGYGVTVVTDAAATSADAVGMAFVVISNAPLAGAKFRDSATAVVVWDGSVMAQMAMVPPTPGIGYGTTAADQTKLSIAAPGHPLAGRLQGEVTVVTAPEAFTWGVPAGGATKVATLLNDPARATVFGHEVGAALHTSAAVDRRVGLFLGPATGTLLTADGALMVDAALQWAADSDPDGDGLGTADEYRWGSDPHDPDSNDDGLLDGASVVAGISPTSLDVDGDGLVNAWERTIGTDPFDYDTDDDGASDGTDCYPLDPTFAGCPPSSNQVPPTIQLLEPTNAVLIP